MTSPFLLFDVLGRFLTYLITSSEGTKDNGPKLTRNINLQPSVTFGGNLRLIGRQMRPQTQVISVRRQKLIHWQRSATALFNNRFMRHPKNSVLADVLKTKQSHHKEKKTNLKDADMELEAESNNNEDKLLNKVVLDTLWSLMVELCYVKYFGLEQCLRK